MSNGKTIKLTAKQLSDRLNTEAFDARLQTDPDRESFWRQVNFVNPGPTERYSDRFEVGRYNLLDYRLKSAVIEQLDDGKIHVQFDVDDGIVLREHYD